MAAKATINVYMTLWGDSPGFPEYHRNALASGRSMEDLESEFARRGDDRCFVVTKTTNTTDPVIGAELTTKEVDALIQLGTTVNITAKPGC